MSDLSALRQSAESCFQQGRMMEIAPHEVMRLINMATQPPGGVVVRTGTVYLDFRSAPLVAVLEPEEPAP